MSVSSFVELVCRAKIICMMRHACWRETIHSINTRNRKISSTVHRSVAGMQDGDVDGSSYWKQAVATVYEQRYDS